MGERSADAPAGSPTDELAQGAQALAAAAQRRRGGDVAARRRVDAASRLITRADAEWPAQLDDLEDHAPLCLWVRGDPAVLRATRPIGRPGRCARRDVVRRARRDGDRRRSGGRRHPGRLGWRVRNRRCRPPRGAGRRRTDGRTARRWRGSRIPGRSLAADRPDRRDGCRRERGAVRIRADEVALPAAESTHRGAAALRRSSSRRAGAAARSTPPAHAAALARPARRRARPGHECGIRRDCTGFSASSARSASRAPPTSASCSGVGLADPAGRRAGETSARAPTTRRGCAMR